MAASFCVALVRLGDFLDARGVGSCVVLNRACRALQAESARQGAVGPDSLEVHALGTPSGVAVPVGIDLSEATDPIPPATDDAVPAEGLSIPLPPGAVSRGGTSVWRPESGVGLIRPSDVALGRITRALGDAGVEASVEERALLAAYVSSGYFWLTCAANGGGANF